MKFRPKFIHFLIAWLVFTAIISLIRPYDATDDAANKTRSGLQLYTDYGTGCQYIKGSYFAALTPRKNAQGQHLCRGVRQ